MGKRHRFVVPDTTQLPLSDGDWVEVKKRLTVGDERAAMQAVVGVINQDGSRSPNLKMVGIAEVMAYLVDWSFTDAQDKRVPLSVDAVLNLDPESFKEIEAAVEAHAKAIQEALAAQKNALSTPTASGATS